MNGARSNRDPAAHALFAALLDAAVDGIIVIDTSGKVLVFNRGAQKLFGYAPDDVLGHNVSILMPDPYEANHDRYLEHYMETGEKRIIGIGREVQARSKDGEIFPIDLSVGEAEGPEGRLFVGIVRDLRHRAHLEAELRTERRAVRELERRLAHVHRTSTLGEMAAGIAHEMNQPLAAISTYADACSRLLARGMPDPDKLAHALGSIGAQARRAGEVVQRIRGLSRQEPSPRERASINDIVGDLIELAKLEARESDAPLHLDLQKGLPAVHVDPVQIQQVLLNLIRNGLEALVKRSQAAQGLTVSTRLADGAVEVCVADRGVGVPADRVDTIFDPFETSKPDGMGIGLSICSTIVRRHGGRLWYEPNPGGGSRFLFTLPAQEDTS